MNTPPLLFGWITERVVFIVVVVVVLSKKRNIEIFVIHMNFFLSGSKDVGGKPPLVGHLCSGMLAVVAFSVVYAYFRAEVWSLRLKVYADVGRVCQVRSVFVFNESFGDRAVPPAVVLFPVDP